MLLPLRRVQLPLLATSDLPSFLTVTQPIGERRGLPGVGVDLPVGAEEVPGRRRASSPPPRPPCPRRPPPPARAPSRPCPLAVARADQPPLAQRADAHRVDADAGAHDERHVGLDAVLRVADRRPRRRRAGAWRRGLARSQPRRQPELLLGGRRQDGRRRWPRRSSRGPRVRDVVERVAEAHLHRLLLARDRPPRRLAHERAVRRVRRRCGGLARKRAAGSRSPRVTMMVYSPVVSGDHEVVYEPSPLSLTFTRG